MNLEPFYQWLQSVNLSTKQHQMSGFTWCMKNEMNGERLVGGFKGGILADEMGLGKTILMLGSIICNPLEKTLIVLPPALLQQWIDAIEKFCPTLAGAVHIWHGKKGTNDDAFDRCMSNEVRVVLTTYGMIANRNIEHYASDLWLMEWDRIIYDEAHHLRNHDTNTFRGAHKMHVSQEKMPIFWFVSGTPINNKLGDVVSLLILAGVSPREYCVPDTLSEIMETKMLRRTKESVGIEMPKCNENIIEVDFDSKAEKKFANDLHSTLSFTAVTEDNIDECMAFLSEHWFGMLTRSRQVCVYPQMVTQVLKKKKRALNIGKEINLAKLNGVNTHSKISSVVNKIKENSLNGKNKIVFCHYRAEIDKLEELLSDTLNVHTLDGRTSKKERNNILKDDTADVLLIQIQTGCEGLNLQQYSEVYFTSPHWNPAVEDQAIARAHRIGQTKDVDVYRFISKLDSGLTLDQYCRCVQNVKREIQNKYIKITNEN